MRCMYCGRMLKVPSAGEPQPAVDEPQPELEAPPPSEERVLRTHPASTRLPVLALVLAILVALDAGAVGFASFVLWMGSRELAAQVEASRRALAESESSDEGDAAVRRLKEAGKNILLNREVIGPDGKRYRRIEFTERNGSPGSESVDLGPGTTKRFTAQEKEDITQAARLMQVALFIGLALMIVSGVRLACSLGVLLRYNWARAGLVILAAIQSILLLVAYFGARAPGLLFVSLAFNGLVFFVFLSNRARMACDR